MANIKLPPGEWRLEFPDLAGFQRNVRIPPSGPFLESIQNAPSVIVTNTVTSRVVTMHPSEELLPNGEIRTFDDGPRDVNAGGGGENRPPGNGGGGGGPIRTVGPSPDRPGGGRPEPRVIITEFDQRLSNEQLDDDEHYPKS